VGVVVVVEEAIWGLNGSRLKDTQVRYILVDTCLTIL
jgi:hypothetical protein